MLAPRTFMGALSVATLVLTGAACVPAPADSQPARDPLAASLPGDDVDPLGASLPGDDVDEDTPPDTEPPPPGVSPAGTDWGKAVVESTMARFPTPAALGRWE